MILSYADILAAGWFLWPKLMRQPANDEARDGLNRHGPRPSLVPFFHNSGVANV